MNTKQAKQLSLPDIMSRLGYEPVKITKNGRELWYKSPFRDETDASFHTSYLNGKWIWNDFGDTGGTVIDFVMRYRGLTQVKDALIFLEDMFQGQLFEHKDKHKGQGRDDLFSFQQQSRAAAGDFSETQDLSRQLEFMEAHPIRNQIIYTYLEGRGISRQLADLYLCEVKYWNHSKPQSKQKPFFGFGMMNESGGYEIRAASDQYSFKSALIARDISFVPGKAGEGSVNVFEGMTDFLSLLMMLTTDRLNGDSIVLHSLSSFHRAVLKIKENGYSTINLFLDNNPAGRKATLRFKEEFGDYIYDKSPFFPHYIDLNDALKNQFIPAFRSSPSPPEI